MNHADRQAPNLAVEVTQKVNSMVFLESCVFLFLFFVLQIFYLYIMVSNFVVFMLFLCVWMCGSVFSMVFLFLLFFFFVSSCFVLVSPLIDYFLMYKRAKCGFGWSEKWGGSGRSRGRGNCEQNILYEEKTFKKQNRRIQWEIKWPLDLCRSGSGGRDEGERTEGRTARSLLGIGGFLHHFTQL